MIRNFGSYFVFTSAVSSQLLAACRAVLVTANWPSWFNRRVFECFCGWGERRAGAAGTFQDRSVGLHRNVSGSVSVCCSLSTGRLLSAGSRRGTGPTLQGTLGFSPTVPPVGRLLSRFEWTVYLEVTSLLSASISLGLTFCDHISIKNLPDVLPQLIFAFFQFPAVTSCLCTSETNWSLPVFDLDLLFSWTVVCNFCLD